MEEIETLSEENWLLYSQVRMDRTSLFIEIMKVEYISRLVNAQIKDL